jgi:transcriptional regulator with XRE-family HTH domain
MNDEVFLKKLGANIRKIRLSKGLTQVQLGDLCDSEKSSINRIESGRTNPTVTTIKKIAENLEVSIDEVFRF